MMIKTSTEIKFVQIGSKGHLHRPLEGENVIDFIGQTEGREDGMRRLFNLFLNAQGEYMPTELAIQKGIFVIG